LFLYDEIIKVEDIRDELTTIMRPMSWPVKKADDEARATYALIFSLGEVRSVLYCISLYTGSKKIADIRHIKHFDLVSPSFCEQATASQFSAL
jgi:hypothetical protein